MTLARASIPLMCFVAMLSGCGGTTSPTNASQPALTAAASAPGASVPTTTLSPASPTPVAGAGSACPPEPPEASAAVAPFEVGRDYTLSAGDGGIDNPPTGLVALTAWNVAGSGGCIASVLAFTFGSAAAASTFAQEQAENIGLTREDIDSTAVWFSSTGDAVRLAIGDVALSVTLALNPPNAQEAHDLVRSIVEASKAAS